MIALRNVMNVRSTQARLALLIAGVAAALVLLATAVVLPRSTPLGVILLGVVLGGLYSLLAIGIILIYRTNRIINFAHGELGAFGGVLAAMLIANGWNYFLAAATGIGTAGLLALLIEVGIIRRFANSPRLILTVATIGLSIVLVGLELFLPRLFDRDVVSDFVTPLTRFRFTVEPVVFDGNHVLVVAFVIAVVVALGVFLRSDYGIAVRAASENADRSALCGIPIRRLSTGIWCAAGLLSGAAAVLQGPVVGLQVGVLIGPGLLLRALAAAVIARMTSLPVAVGAAMGLAVLEQSLFWSYGRTTVIDAALLIVILVALLLQRGTLSRTDPADASTWQAITEVRPIPLELAGLPEVRIARVVIGGLVAALAVGLPILFDTGRQNLSSVVVVYALVGLSLVVLTGWAGQISLGQFAIVGIGAAVAGSLSAEAGWDFVLTLFAGGAAGLVAALVLGLPALRVSGFFLAVTTLAFAVATSSFLLRQPWLAPGVPVNRPMLFSRVNLASELSYYYVCLAVLVLAIAGTRSLRRSRMGRAIVAVRDNDKAAQSYGINTVVVRLTAFAVSGFIAGVAGALLVHHQHAIPATQYAPQQSLNVFLLAVIGGLGSIPGAIIGAVYVKGLQYLLQGPGAFLSSGIGVLVILLVLPRGLGSVVFAIRDALLTRVALRREMLVPSLVADRREEAPDDLDVELREVPLGAPQAVVEAAR